MIEIIKDGLTKKATIGKLQLKIAVEIF